MKPPTHIKNPLTVIGLFACVAEAAACLALPALTGRVQMIFTAYAVGFPILVLLLFFATLNWNNRVLYAPSDYHSDHSFLCALKQTTGEVAAERKAKLTDVTASAATAADEDNYRIVQQAVITRLRSSYEPLGRGLSEHVKFQRDDMVVTFDAVITTPGAMGVGLVDIWWVPQPSRSQKTLDQLEDEAEEKIRRYIAVAGRQVPITLVMVLVIPDRTCEAFLSNRSDRWYKGIPGVGKDGWTFTYEDLNIRM